MPVSKRAFALSILIHTLVFAIGFLAMVVIGSHPVQPTKIVPVTNHRIYNPPPRWLIAKDRAGAGGGGQRQPLPASKGALPGPRKVFTPPQVDPPPAALILPASIELPPDVPASALAEVGNPLSRSGLLSGGTGGPGGIGDAGCCNGIGDRKGPGFGDGPGGVGIAGVHAAIAPVLIYSVEPEYTEEARKARYSGTVVMLAEIDESGRAVKMRIIRPLGLGLDERALEAVAKWRFRPGKGRDGKPVRTAAQVEVNFRLL